MAVVRDNLEALEALHAAGASWVDLAAGLAAQGVTQGQGDPLTDNRLTALIASVKRQAARQAEAKARRRTRPDLPRPSTPSVARQGLPDAAPSPAAARLAPELQARPAAPPGDDAPPSEAEIRRIQAERHSHLFKKD